MARKRANLTDLLNNLTFRTLHDKYKLIAMNAFEWSGLPDGIQERHIERELFSKGKAIFFRDPLMSYMCLECGTTGNVNIYGDPTHYIAHGFNYNKTYKADECVIIENNKLRLPTDPFIMFYVNKLTEAERTMDVNVKANKTPVVFTCDDKDALTFKALFNQVDGNVPAIYADKNLNIDSVKAFQTGVKFLGNELMDYKRSVESELLTFLGVNNSPIDKKERLITDEANSNNQLIESFCDLQLEARQRACEAINELYGLNVSVKKRAEPVEMEVETDVV
jgi:hypothetical protein